MAGDAQERMGIFPVWKTQQASRVSLATCRWIKERCFRESSNWFWKVCSISGFVRSPGFVYCVFLCETNKLERKKRMLSQAIACEGVQPPFFYPGNHRRSFFLRKTRLRIVGLIGEISTKTIHIKEKNKGNVFIYLPTGSLRSYTLFFWSYSKR